MATAKKPAAGAKKASPAKSAKSKSSTAAGAGRATTRGRGAGAAAKTAAKGAAKSASKSAAKGAAKSASKAASKSAAKSATKSAAKSATKAASKKAPAKSTAGKRGPNPAFMKPLRPDAQLAAVVGDEPMPRTQVVSRVWEYVKKNNLQESRNINADEKLRPIFGKDQITMFEMMKLVNAHLSDA
jgi:chromatin remodeling complex protein RSC6